MSEDYPDDETERMIQYSGYVETLHHTVEKKDLINLIDKYFNKNKKGLEDDLLYRKR